MNQEQTEPIAYSVYECVWCEKTIVKRNISKSESARNLEFPLCAECMKHHDL